MINSPSTADDSPEVQRTYRVREVVDTPRTNPEENEDMLLIHRRRDSGITVLILDGATGVGDVVAPYKDGMAAALNVPRVSGGRFASFIVKQEIERLLARDTQLAPKELLLRGAEALRQRLQIMGVQQDHFTQVASTLGALADLDASGTMRYACIRADVSVLIMHRDGTWDWHPTDHPLDYHEGKALAVALHNHPSDISQSLINDTEVQNYINRKNRGGENVNTYGSLNGAERETMEEWMTEGETQLQRGDTVYLFTDGFLPEKPRRAYESETAFNEEQRLQRERVVEALHKEGAEGLLRLVRTQQQNDPTCTLYPRFKAVGDDATLVEIKA